MECSHHACTCRIRVQPTSRSDFGAVAKLQQRARPLFMPWTRGQLASHLRHFREGQLAAFQDGALVGSCASLKIRLADGEPPTGWIALTGHGYFHTHDPAGDVLYVASLAIEPRACRASVRRALDDALLRLALAERVTRILLPVRLPAYVPLATQLSPEGYLACLQEGRAADPVFDGLRELGFRAVGLLPDLDGKARPNDHLAALLEWRAGAA